MTRKCKARFVSDVTCADGAVFEAGAPIVKTWRILNAGRDAWPEGTTLLRVGGDDVLPAGAPQAVAVAPAAAGEHVDVSAELLAPEASGRYVSYWRLQDKDGNRFGQRFWCMFHVVDGAAEAEAEALPDQDELVQEAEAVEAVLEAGLSALQARAVMQAFRRRVHLGIVCDVTGSAPIIGVRHTRPNANGDSYDVCEAGLGQLPEEERAGLTAMPRPDVKALIRTVLAKGERFGFAQAASHAAAELEPPAAATAAEEQLAAEEQAARAMLKAKLNAVQAMAVMAAFRDGVHLGITCDVTGQSPITGTRYTRPTGDDTYDVSEAAFGALPEAERAALAALPRPDVHLLIKHVLGAEAAALAEAETRAAEDAAAAEAEAEAQAAAEAAAAAAAAAEAEAEAEAEARAEAEVAARYKQQAAMAEAAAQAAIVEADIVEAEAQAAAAAAAEPIVPAERNAAAQQMMAMGFADQALVMAALAQHGDDIAAAVAQLLR